MADTPPYPGMPTWVKWLIGIFAAGVVLAFVAMHLLGGGPALHGR